MIISFRHGIVSYPTNANGNQNFLQATGQFVSLNATNGVTDVAIAHKTANYLHTESVSVPNAWGPLPAASTVWLYWDINTLTAERTFGYTDLQPIAQPTAPVLPEQDQHWFDTNTMTMRVWTGTRWQEKIRVFAAEYDTGASTFTSVSILSNQQRFDGTQIGVQGSTIPTGRIIVDSVGRPVTNHLNVFFTTEDDFFINGSPITAIRLESSVVTATSVENIAAYQVVTFTDFDRVEPASYHDLQQSMIAIAVEDVLREDIGSFIVQGVITNPAWNWPTVGASLWVSEGGALTATDPHIADTATYNVGKAPVARVLGRQSIFFDQGLGGKGDKGDSALAGGGIGEAATMTDLGKVKLTVEPTDPGSPYVVETNDPRMTNARDPLPHTHPASQIVPTPVGTSVNGTLQQTLENLDGSRVNKNGDTMTGTLRITSIPTDPSGAVPKSYVDTFVPLSQRGSANGVATLDAFGRLSQSQIPQISITDTFVVATEAAMLNLTAQTGDTCVRTDVNKTFILRGTNPSLLGDWQELLAAPNGVQYLNITAPSSGISITGGPVTSSGTFTVSLTDDLAAIEQLTGNGVAHRTGTNTWEVKPVDLSASVSNTLPVANGGTGATTLNGYVKASGTSPFTASSTIPGPDVFGTLPNATISWSAVTGKPSTIAGYGITDAYTQAQTNALTWNWSQITNRPTSYIGYGITDVYSKTEINTALAMKANVATTLSGYGITDAAPLIHTHILDTLDNVNTASKAAGDVLSWNGTNWSPLTIGNAVLPATISGKLLDSTNTYVVRDDGFTVENTTTPSRRFRFDASAISASTTRILTIPNADGTIALTNGLGASGSWNINAASATTVPWIGVSGTPTTIAGYGITDAYTKAETEALSWNWSSITGCPTTLSGYGITDAYTRTETNALVWNWSQIINRPSTLAGYGIADAYTQAQINALTWNWSSITGRPTTLSGYGITDAAPLVHNHDSAYVKLTDIGATVASLDISGKVPVAELPDTISTRTYFAASEAEHLTIAAVRGDVVIRTDESRTYILRANTSVNMADWAQIVTPEGGGGTVTSVAITQPASGITITGGPILTNGTFVVTLTDDLAAIEALSSTGYVKRTGLNAWSASPSVEASEVSGVLTVAQGGTGATTPSSALAALGGAPLTGTGASGTWDISITGNAATATNASTVTNGVYTDQAYADPAWITSLAPEKVVATWSGSENISQVGPEIDFGVISRMRSGLLTTTALGQAVLDTFDITAFGSARYTIQAKNATDAQFVDVYVTLNIAADTVYTNQVGTGSANEVVAISAIINGTNVELIVDPVDADTEISYTVLLM